MVILQATLKQAGVNYNLLHHHHQEAVITLRRHGSKDRVPQLSFILAVSLAWPHADYDFVMLYP